MKNLGDPLVLNPKSPEGRGWGAGRGDLLAKGLGRLSLPRVMKGEQTRVSLSFIPRGINGAARARGAAKKLWVLGAG